MNCYDRLHPDRVDEEVVVISVNRNPNCPSFTSQAGYSISINENYPLNSFVIQVNASDADGVSSWWWLSHSLSCPLKGGTLVGELHWSDQHWYRLPFWKERSGNFQLVFAELWLSFLFKASTFILASLWTELNFCPPPPCPPQHPTPYLHPNFDFLARNMTT